MKIQAPGADDPEDGAEVGTALARERLVQAFPREPGIPCDLRHAPGSSDVAEGLGDERCIAFGFLKAGPDVGSHLLGDSEVFGNVVVGGLGHCSRSSMVHSCRGGIGVPADRGVPGTASVASEHGCSRTG